MPAFLPDHGHRRQFRRRMNFLGFANCIVRYHSVLTHETRHHRGAHAAGERAPTRWPRYSRSPDSIRQSIDWVRTHDSQKFLESFYFQYGHASIADLGHTVICFGRHL